MYYVNDIKSIAFYCISASSKADAVMFAERDRHRANVLELESCEYCSSQGRMQSLVAKHMVRQNASREVRALFPRDARRAHVARSASGLARAC